MTLTAVAIVLSILLGAAASWGLARSRLDHLKDELRQLKHKGNVSSLVNHVTRVTVEQATMPERPWASGRTWTDEDDVTHSMPAAFFAVTMCGLTVPCVAPNEEEIVRRYPYDANDGTRAKVANCVACLAKEGCG